MPTYNEIIYSVLDKLKPHLTDDVDISPREVAWEIDNARALFLRNELNKNRTIDPNITQDLGCVEMESSDRAECCDISTDCLIIRTKLEIPAAIELHNDTAITRVGPVDKMDLDFSFITYNRAKFAGNGKYNKNIIYAFLRNNRIYLVSKNDKVKFINYINVAGVFENPTDVTPFTNCGGDSCFSSDSEYPLNTWMVSYIQEAVINKFLGSLRMPTDTTNDGAETSPQQPTK
jgi:hypothetical protein